MIIVPPVVDNFSRMMVVGWRQPGQVTHFGDNGHVCDFICNGDDNCEHEGEHDSDA